MDPSGPAASAQLQYTVHCGPLLTAPPVIIVPTFGGATSFITATGFTSCLVASAILYGGGAAGTATITATYVGDITGATELLVRKNRNGRTGYVDLYFYAQWLRFEDMLDPDP